MSKNNLGKVIITPQGLWSETTEYKHLDVVYALDASYLAKKDNQGVSVTDNSVWQPLAGRGPAGTGNVTVLETGLQTGKKYLFVPSANNSTEGYFEEYIPSEFNQQQADWNQNQTDQPDFIKNKPPMFSGDYNDLQNTPSIPDKISDLDNDTSFITQMEVEAHYQPLEAGKGLSTNDYTTSEKSKLGEIEKGAQKNRPIIHKSITLEPSDWELFDSYMQEINDADIVGGMEVSPTWAANKADRENYLSNGIWAIASVGKIIFYAETRPIVNINTVYTLKI